jgi:hypothetical protein
MVILSPCLTNQALRHEGIWGSGCIDPYFFTSALAVVEWSASCPGRFIPEERTPAAHWMGGWVGPSAGLEDVEKRKFLFLPGLKFQHLGGPARSQSLYRLRYPGSS